MKTRFILLKVHIHYYVLEASQNPEKHVLTRSLAKNQNSYFHYLDTCPETIDEYDSVYRKYQDDTGLLKQKINYKDAR